uniref:Putative secreted protein n=1 Tax=Ixodes ricinus TaxID=34613 RepID=A0A6B0UPL7_IXORI
MPAAGSCLACAAPCVAAADFCFCIKFESPTRISATSDSLSPKFFCDAFSVRFYKLQLVLHRVKSSRTPSFSFLCLRGGSAVAVSTYISDYTFQVPSRQRKCAATHFATIDRFPKGTLPSYV